MRHLLAASTVVALLVTSAGAVGAQEASPDPGASPTPEQLAAAEERLATATCLGKPATIVAIEGFETVGTSGVDVIVGTGDDDIIRGQGGNDRICAGAGADLVDGGEGKDRIDGGAGDDQLDGGMGNDTIAGGKGADMVFGAAGNDRLSGATGDDPLDGGRGNDICAGGPGHDWLPGCNDKRRTRGTLNLTKNTTLKGPHRGDIIIAANKVTLDCAGHTVTGRGGGIGILLGDERKAITVKNCEVTNFGSGITLVVAHRNKLERNYVHGNAGTGISVHRSNKNKLTSNVADHNGLGAEGGWGFQIENWHRNVLKHNSTSGNNGHAFVLWNGSSRNKLSSNTSTVDHGGFIVDGDRNTIHRNSVTDSTSVGFETTPTADDNTYTDNIVAGGMTGLDTPGL